MISISRRVLSNSLSILCLFAGCLLLLSGCSGGGSTGGGGGGGTTSYTITVASANPASGVSISYGNASTSLLTTGTTPFSVTENSGTTMIFGAPATAGNNNFSSWSGCTSVSGANCTVAVSGNVTITANYVTPVAPAVTVTPSPATITTAQALSVAVAVAASQGGATPTGSVVLTSGTYTSAATALSNGSATISIPAGSLAAGTASLKATYTPDTAASVNYTTASGTASVTVNPPPVPTISLSLSASTIVINQALTATVTVSGTPTPTGSVALSGGGLSSAISGTLSNGTATINVPANSLSAGSQTLTATYTPDSASSANWSSGSKTASITVNAIYTLTVNTTNPSSGVAITVNTADLNGHQNGNSPLSLSYASGTNVILTAPSTSGSNPFSGWSGCNTTSSVTCNVTVNANTTVTAVYNVPSQITVSPATGNVTIGQPQQFTATVTGLNPSTVTWSVAVASGSGSPGTISSAGLYETPYPAPTSVTITATSTANTAIKGTATVSLVAPSSTTGPALSIDTATVTRAISPLIYGMNGYLLDPTTAKNANTTVVRWGGDDTSRYNYQTGVVNSAADYYFENFTGIEQHAAQRNHGQRHQLQRLYCGDQHARREVDRNRSGSRLGLQSVHAQRKPNRLQLPEDRTERPGLLPEPAELQRGRLRQRRGIRRQDEPVRQQHRRILHQYRDSSADSAIVGQRRDDHMGSHLLDRRLGQLPAYRQHKQCELLRKRRRTRRQHLGPRQ